MDLPYVTPLLLYFLILLLTRMFQNPLTLFSILFHLLPILKICQRQTYHGYTPAYYRLSIVATGGYDKDCHSKCKKNVFYSSHACPPLTASAVYLTLIANDLAACSFNFCEISLCSSFVNSSQFLGG